MLFHHGFALFSSPKSLSFELGYPFVHFFGKIISKHIFYFSELFLCGYMREHFQEKELCRIEDCCLSLF